MLRAAMPEGIRDNDFDLEAYHRLAKLCVRMRRDGWDAEGYIAAANLNLHLGNWKEAERYANELADSHPDEALVIMEAAEALRHRPSRTRREWPT